MRLTDLHPQFFGAGGPGISHADGSPVPLREGVGLLFDCPCGCAMPCAVMFTNPLDGGPALTEDERHFWSRTGDTFETLTLTPSILRSPDKGGCGWHGYITDGVIVTI